MMELMDHASINAVEDFRQMGLDRTPARCSWPSRTLPALPANSRSR